MRLKGWVVDKITDNSIKGWGTENVNAIWRLDHEDADDAAQATSGLRLLNALIRKRALFARWKQCAEERGNKAGSRSPHRKRIGPVAHAEQEEQTCVKLSARVETLQKQLSEANDAIESLQKEKRTRFEHLWQKVYRSEISPGLTSHVQAVEVGQEQLASFLEKHELERTILLHRIRFLESVVGEVNHQTCVLVMPNAHDRTQDAQATGMG
eukprot:768671-Hanusia_phi.AAC.1